MKESILNIREANAWAEKVWEENLEGWENRNQDYNYRKLLARPGIQEMLRKLPAVQDGIFVDLGCGDGSEMRHIGNYLAHCGSSGIFYGFDLQADLVMTAASKLHDNAAMKYLFDFGDLGNLLRKHGLTRVADRIFSTFLIQELSDAESHLRMVSECLRENGYGVFLLLHPSFGNAMLRKSAIRVNAELKSDSFEWAGEYPIVEENGGMFYVPYFHRTMRDYKTMFEKFFSLVTFFEKQPTNLVIEKARREKLSPFYDHPGNVYYPEIIRMPSALYFVVKK